MTVSPWGTLALAAIAAVCSGCIITDPPQFTEPTVTKPFLLANTAQPDYRKLLIVGGPVPEQLSYEFSAQVMSQDDAHSSSLYDVDADLYIDYGYPAPSGQPFRWYFTRSADTGLAPGNLSDTGRRLSVTWTLTDQDPVDPGCHTATLVASHFFSAKYSCPACLGDYTTVTWQILRCASGDSRSDCLARLWDDPACQDGYTQVSCETVLKDKRDLCPDDSPYRDLK